jgi:hypothetical protein
LLPFLSPDEGDDDDDDDDVNDDDNSGRRQRCVPSTMTSCLAGDILSTSINNRGYLVERL